MLKDAKVFHCSNGLTMFAATLHCPLDDLLNRPGAWDEIRFMVFFLFENFRPLDFYLCYIRCLSIKPITRKIKYFNFLM